MSIRLMLPVHYEEYFEDIRSVRPSHRLYIESLVQDCSNSIANALEFRQSRTKPSINHMRWSSYCFFVHHLEIYSMKRTIHPRFKCKHGRVSELQNVWLKMLTAKCRPFCLTCNAFSVLWKQNLVYWYVSSPVSAQDVTKNALLSGMH